MGVGTFGQTIELPWPPAKLSPNARLHWRALHKVKTAYKDDCLLSLLGQSQPHVLFGDRERIPLTITFHPPDNRRRDRDNMQSSFKYGLDKLASWLGVDDYLFDPTYRFAEPVKGGKVLVTL